MAGLWKIEKRHRSPEELQRIYQDCCAKQGITLLHSKLYVCPFEANAINLGAIPKVLSTELSLDKLSNNDETINTWSNRHSHLTILLVLAIIVVAGPIRITP